jgi:polysaccharide chain length determinant protein (PEP-CTERM system associated)
VLPGKTYTLEDIVQIALRRKRWILLPLVIAFLSAVEVGRLMPERYRSETVMMLLPQRIPDNYVRSSVTMGLQDRLTTLNQKIMSRSRLEQIILEFNLYAAERRTLPMDDVVNMMRSDIDPIKLEIKDSASTTFKIGYVGRDPATVQKVATRLASLFIEENVRDRASDAEGTNKFLDAQLEDARRRLIVQEKKLEEYRRAYSGELPSQASTNLQTIQNAEMQLQALSEAEDRDRERRLIVQRQLADVDAPDMAGAAAAGGDGAVQGTAEQLEAARAELRALQMHLTPNHPDIRMQQRTIRDLEAKLEVESRDTRNAEIQRAGRPKPPTPAEITRQRRIRDLRTELEDVDRQLREKQDQGRRLLSVVSQYQAKLEALPKRETELVELTRDYETLQGMYAGLLEKREESKLAVNLEKKNIGEQFQILDPAKEPEKPFSPNRPLIDLGGAVAGLIIGALLIAFAEYRDTSFRSEADVIRVLQLPVLALVPPITPYRGRKLLP